MRPIVGELRAAVDDKRARLLAAADARRAAVVAAAEAQRSALLLAGDELARRIIADAAGARADVRRELGSAREAVLEWLAVEKVAGAEAVAGEADRVTAEAARLAGSVIDVAQKQRDAADELGEREAGRAEDLVATEAAQARREGEQYTSSLHDTDFGRLEARWNAAHQVAEEQAREIERTAPEIADSARQQASEIAADFSDDARGVADEIDASAPDVAAAVGSVAGMCDAQMDGMAQTAIDGLDDVERELVAGIDELEAEGLVQAQGVVASLVPQVDAVEQSALDQADGIAQDGGEKLDALALESLLSMVEAPGGIGGRRRRLAGAVEQSQQQLEQLVSALNVLGQNADEQLLLISGEFARAQSALQEMVGGGMVSAAAGAQTAGTELLDQSVQGFELANDAVLGRAAELADDAVGEWSKAVDQTTGEFDQAFSKGEREVTSGVTKALAENEHALSELPDAMVEAAEEAAEEYDRPAWKRALYAIGSFIVNLVKGLIIVLVVALVIFLAAAFLGIAAITFAVAFKIALVVVIIGSIALSFYHRVQAYRAEHGPVDSFWEALGISVSLLGISILDFTGVPSAIEGARGRRFFSDIQLSEQERYDLVIGGVLQVLLLGLGLRGRRGGGGSKGTGRAPIESTEARPPAEGAGPARPPVAERAPTPEKPPVAERGPIPEEPAVAEAPREPAPAPETPRAADEGARPRPLEQPDETSRPAQAAERQQRYRAEEEQLRRQGREDAALEEKSLADERGAQQRRLTREATRQGERHQPRDPARTASVRAGREAGRLYARAKAGEFTHLSDLRKQQLLERYSQLLEESGASSQRISSRKGVFDEYLRTPRAAREAGAAQKEFLAGGPRLAEQTRRGTARSDYSWSRGGGRRPYVNLKGDSLHTLSRAECLSRARKYTDQAISNARALPAGEPVIIRYANSPPVEVQQAMARIHFGPGSPIEAVHFGSRVWRRSDFGL